MLHDSPWQAVDRTDNEPAGIAPVRISLEVSMFNIDSRLQDAGRSGGVCAYRPGMFQKRSDELRSMAIHLRNFPTNSGELEIWMHNWARVLERVALEMECIDPCPEDDNTYRHSFGSLVD